jgi:chemotaxis protein CheZ
MPAPRKIFRIEQMSLDGAGDPPADWPAPSQPAPMAAPASASAPPTRPVPMRAAAMLTPDDDEAARRHHELIAEIKALRNLVEPKDDAQRILETYHAQLTEMQKLKGELVIIHNAIIRTKQEIATLHVTGFHGQSVSRMTHELDAVVNGTEQATQIILNMVEDIDQLASTMSEQGKDDAEKQMGREIQDRVVKVFEACNFQDITGQRISKVVNTWKFIESHVVQMMEIWGGIDAFKEFIPEEPPKPEGDDALLNGPKLEEDVGHASQDDIDALFP